MKQVFQLKHSSIQPACVCLMPEKCLDDHWPMLLTDHYQMLRHHKKTICACQQDAAVARSNCSLVQDTICVKIQGDAGHSG